MLMLQLMLSPLLQEFSGQRCWVSGWGKDALGEEGAYQPVLKEVGDTDSCSYLVFFS